jgi:hypothetical protein
MIEPRTPEKIHFAIEKKLSLGATYIDALIEYAIEQNIEIETVAEIIKKSSTIKEKVRLEARERRMLKDNGPSPQRLFE